VKEIKAIIQTSRLEKVLLALHKMRGLPGCTVSHVHGYGKSDGGSVQELPEWEERTKLEIVVKDSDAKKVVAAIVENAHSGGPGDGKIFVMNCEEIVSIRSGKRGSGAL
jgi:nitrogen regulatory protein PII